MSTSHDGPRYTLMGSRIVEKRIGATIARAAGLVANEFHPREYRALVLLGGYGRGEGGIHWESGVERPHNNLDFLLVTTYWGAMRKAAFKRRLDEVLAPIVAAEEIGIDTGVISAIELQHAPGRVIWFDLRWGHRTILGDAAFIPALSTLTAADIEIDDVYNLLVNRASLLVINDAIVDRGIASDDDIRFIIKHLMKSIIGHGDAFLFTRGRYHASYLEKQRRMRELSNSAPDLAELYEMASAFRFAPDYARYMRNGLLADLGKMREVLARIYYEFERFRAELMKAEVETRGARVFRAKPLSFDVMRRHRPRSVLAMALPGVLYGTNDEQRRCAQRILGARSCTPSDIRKAYLQHWSVHGDPNFAKTAQLLGL